MDEKQLEVIFKEDVIPALSKQPLTPETQPVGYVLGGQPGAGKSQLLQQAKTEQQGNIAVINADEFRKFHPDFKAIAQQHGTEAANHTSQFAGAMVQKAMQYCIENRFNLAIEGTFRTAETPLKTLGALKTAGYQTEVMIGTCPKEVSWASTLERYTKGVAAGMGTEARFTPKDAHDQTVSQLANNVKQVTAAIGTVSVHSRDSLLYRGNNPQEAAQAVQKELTRPLNLSEYQATKRSHEAVLKVVEGKDKENLTKSQAAFLIRQQRVEDINKHPALAEIQKKIESVVKAGRDRTEAAHSQASLIEKGALSLTAPSQSRER